MILRPAAALPANRMSVVEPDQPLTVRPMQGERAVEPMRLLRRCLNAPHDEPHPMTTFWIHDEHLSVEV